MIQWILYSLIFIVLGALILAFPELVNYAHTDTWYIDLAKLLKDYPVLRTTVGVAFLCLGVAGIIVIALLKKRRNTAFVIQQSEDNDYGNPSLRFPWFVIGVQEPLIYENIASLNRNDEPILDLEKQRIARFYGNLKCRKRIAFLSVAPFPFIVYAGFTVGNAGQKVTYFHYDQKKSRSRWVRPGLSPSCSLIALDHAELDKSKDELTICVSVSYEIEEPDVSNQFSKTNIIFLKFLPIGTEVIKNRKTLDSMADKVRETISQQSKHHKSVNLLLSCPAELCFAIGCRLSSPGLPTIKVYNFNKKSDYAKWDWQITLDN